LRRNNPDCEAAFFAVTIQSLLAGIGAPDGPSAHSPAIGAKGKFMANLQLQLNDYRLTTAEILYHMPDHPGVLQSFVWQNYDIAPRYPELRRFLDFWVQQIEGKLHSVMVASRSIISAAEIGHAGAELRLH
jgi:uncharacterized protein Usg